MTIDIDDYTESCSGRPVIRLYGVSAAGNSVCAHVHNFTPYFYVELTFTMGGSLSTEMLEQFRMKLNIYHMRVKDAILDIDIVQKSSIKGYQQKADGNAR